MPFNAERRRFSGEYDLDLPSFAPIRQPPHGIET